MNVEFPKGSLPLQTERAAESSVPEGNASLQLARIFPYNLALLIILGVGLSLWVLYYTDWFPLLGGFIALSGAFSWLAFVSKILPERRLSQLQEWTDQAVFCRPMFLGIFLGLLISGGLLWALALGTIQVESLEGGGGRSLWICSEGSSPGRPLQLPAGGRVRTPKWITSPTPFLVKVDGYPELKVILAPRERIDLQVPHDFLRPVILLRPTVSLLNMLRNDPMPLVVKVDSHEWKIDDYDGHSVWIGCDRNVDVPAARLDAWRGELAAHGQSDHIFYWMHPLALPGARLNLEPGKKVDAQILRTDAGVYAKGTFTVSRIEQRYQFPQEAVLDAPRE